MVICRKNLQHAQELQKRYDNKYTKLKSYTLGEKVWLNSKYIKTKQNRKLETKFFRSFKVLYPVGKQAYKLELLQKLKIHNVFYVSLLKQDTTRRGWLDKITLQIELDKGNSKEYKDETICNNKVYAKESDSVYHLLGLYYLILCKGYIEEKNTWELASAI